MSARRPTMLMGALLLLLIGYYVYQSPWYYVITGAVSKPVEVPPLPGRNSISGLEVKQDEAGNWTASFDYFYTGAPRYVAMRMQMIGQSETPGDQRPFQRRDTYLPMTERGAHHVSVTIEHPGGIGRSKQVLITMRQATGDGKFAVIASQTLDKGIDWPDWATWMRDQQLAKNTPEQNLKQAVDLIDANSESQIEEARAILEKLVSQNPKFDAAYVELARVAMKTNWGPEGLHQGEGLLASALQIRPDSVNAKILLGYVYAHQHRFPQAETLFEEAAASKPDNLWLWSNWGELFVMQGKPDQAIAKYREAIARPISHDANTRAREDAYRNLLRLLDDRKDLDGMEALYKQRVSEFGNGSCYTSDYARFMLQQRGDTDAAIELARSALNLSCQDTPARQVLGLAYYVKWAGTPGPERAESLNQARLFLPAGPMPLYLLATSERTAGAAKKLMASGEQIDQKDNEKVTALAYALQHQDLAAARRLMDLGARPDTPVGYADVPVALVPVIEGDIEAIRLMQRHGVDYSKLRYRGATALDVAKQSGNVALLNVLGRDSHAL